MHAATAMDPLQHSLITCIRNLLTFYLHATPLSLCAEASADRRKAELSEASDVSLYLHFYSVFLLSTQIVVLLNMADLKAYEEL